MSDVSNGGVNYTVKELIARVEAKLDTALAQLALKAEKSEIISLDGRLSNIERLGSSHVVELRRDVEKNTDRILSLEKSNNAHDAVRASYKWLVTLAAGNILSLAAFVLKMFHLI